MADLPTKMLALMKHAFSQGHELALHDAVVLCNESKRPVPAWALAELSRRSLAIARNEKTTKKKGRHASPRTEQEQLVVDAACFAAVNERRESWDRKLRGQDAFTAAADELPLDAESVKKAYYRHRRRVQNRTYYISLAYCLPDYVAYLEHNQALLGW